MSELKSLSPELLIHIAKTLQVPMKGLLATVELLDEGATVPFIARYRKEVTGNLDEVQIRAIEEKLLYFRELHARKETILASIQEQGKLTDELKARIEATLEKSELEDLYLPYKPKRRTKAMIAREKGLEPLANYIWEQEPKEISLQRSCGEFGQCRDRSRRRGGGPGRRAPHHRRDHQRQRRHPQGAAERHVRRGRHRQQQDRRRARRTAEVQDVLRLPRAGPHHSLPSHARHPPRRDGKCSVFPDRARSAAARRASSNTRFTSGRATGPRSSTSPRKTPGSGCSTVPSPRRLVWN